MSDLEQLAEDIVFEHEGDRAVALSETTLREDFEKVAALATVVVSRPCSPPKTLRTRLAYDALRFCAGTTETAPTRPAVATLQASATSSAPRPTKSLLAFLLGAAAASFATWMALTPPAEPSVARLRAQTIAGDKDVYIKWQPGPSPMSGEVTGDVVWRQEHQDGWLTFRALPVLPEDKAYQLWIRDRGRGGDLVDGGVFRIESATDETLVTIDPALNVGDPDAFVVTVEDRAGAVVSKQEHVVAIASL
ncbi:MAG: hypothetical protein CMJ88_13595 [Planctomycetes bacterium]|mgnify:CR=1 FL=1|nr:hypothetical protein [Planctomycetota bacterium]